METLNFKVVFNGHGFEEGKDISEEEMKKLRKIYLKMYNAWCEGVDQIQEKINESWDRYERIKARQECVNPQSAAVAAVAISLCRNAMGINPETDYYDWCEKWYRQVAIKIDDQFADYPLKGKIIRDGELPVYAVEIKGHPEWTMDFELEQI